MQPETFIAEKHHIVQVHEAPGAWNVAPSSALTELPAARVNGALGPGSHAHGLYTHAGPGLTSALPCRYIVLVNRCGNWGSKPISSLPEVTRLMSGNVNFEPRRLWGLGMLIPAPGGKGVWAPQWEAMAPILSTTERGSGAQRD